MRARLILIACTTLAACDKPASQRTVAEKEAAQVEAVKTLTGWDRVFASPTGTVNWINQAGFGLPAYGPTGSDGAHGAQGIERLMSRSGAPSPNMATASVTGSAAERLDQISYVLKLNDPEDAATARARFAETVGQFLTATKIAGGEPVLAAIREGRSDRPTVGGLPVAVTASPARIDVTFIRPAATGAPANS
jgi:hypothetical protein